MKIFYILIAVNTNAYGDIDDMMRFDDKAECMAVREFLQNEKKEKVFWKIDRYRNVICQEIKVGG